VHAEVILARAEPRTLAAELRALVPGGTSVAQTVAEIIDEVRRDGDGAVRRLTETYDTRGARALPLRVSREDLQAALAGLDPDVTAALELADRNVERVSAAPLTGDTPVDFGSHQVTIRHAPVRRAAVYVPGGRAPYPSTVVMGVAAARAAAVDEIVVCSPPGPDGDVNAAILAACAITKADEVYRMGGAQAIAALALGTDTVPAVEVIVGPGNLYVQEAKRQLTGRVGIDSFAGPSDLLVLIDADAATEPAALDLLAQAEHGPGTLVVGVSTSREVLDAIDAQMAAALPETEAVCRLVQVPSLQYGLELAEEFAPEHLELLGTRAEELAPRITRAGCVFVGTGTAFGDYVAGSNHTLPTSGAAAFASSLGAHSFRRTFAEVRIGHPEELARAGAAIARTEGFELHARSMEARISENPAQ
jgi:histidinol dehydrogenase